MPTFVGFSTKEVYQRRDVVRPGIGGGIGGVTEQPRIVKKFRLVDEQLVLRDLLNAFSIRQGEKVGQPAYGSTLMQFVFEPNTADTRDAIETEIRRIINQDLRIQLNTVGIYYQDHGVLIELELAINPFNEAVQAAFFLNRYDGTIKQLAS